MGSLGAFFKETNMGGLNTEVTDKIRAAIRAKLQELGAYVDEELPDYIMVLVANKKNQDQMKDDLSLFLHGHADVFTAWLQDILKKLKQVSKPKPETTKAPKEKKKKKSESKTGKKLKTKSSKIAKSKSPAAIKRR